MGSCERVLRISDTPRGPLIRYLRGEAEAEESIQMSSFRNMGRSVVVVTVLALSVVGLAQPSGAQVIQCGGLDATIIGTDGPDILKGTAGPDVITGRLGNDTIRGLGGDDVICGGYGNDLLYGGQGFDVMYGAQGNDVFFAADGDLAADRMDIRGGRFFGGKGNDLIYGSTRWDRMQGGPGTDTLYGFEGQDWMRGGAGRDVISGGPNADDMHGGNGADFLISEGPDTIRGGASPNDVCEFGIVAPKFVKSCEIEI